MTYVVTHKRPPAVSVSGESVAHDLVLSTCVAEAIGDRNAGIVDALRSSGWGEQEARDAAAALPDGESWIRLLDGTVVEVVVS